MRPYFPDARWFEFGTGNEVGTRGDFADVSAPLDHIPLHVRGGTVIPTQVCFPRSRLNNSEVIGEPSEFSLSEAGLDDFGGA